MDFYDLFFKVIFCGKLRAAASFWRDPGISQQQQSAIEEKNVGWDVMMFERANERVAARVAAPVARGRHEVIHMTRGHDHTVKRPHADNFQPW